MRKMGILGHRGAAGEALENTLSSLQKALETDVDGIEFDVRRTKDGQLVLLHDHHTGRVAKKRVRASELTLAQLQELVLKNGEHLPSLEEVFRLIGNKKTVVIDIKDIAADEIIRLSRLHPDVTIELTSKLYDELRKLHRKHPQWPIYVLDRLGPIGIVHIARTIGATGISMSKWLINPITYRLARRHGLNVRIYTVNSLFLARVLRRLYPEASLYTNHPTRLLAQLGR